MKFVFTLLSAAALLAPGISAAPVEARGALEARVTRDYDIDTAIATWIRKPHVKDIMNSVCSTDGGWEGWAQIELELALKNAFQLDNKISIREKTDVYSTQERADFVLPKTDRVKGMIIELKCENKNKQKGGAMETPVGKDKDKKFSVNPAYADYTFVALALAYSPEAEKALTKIGMKSIPDAKVVLSGGRGTMKAFKEILKQLTADIKDLNDLFATLNTNSRPTSPAPGPKTPPGSPKTPPKKPVAPAGKPAAPHKKPAGSRS